MKQLDELRKQQRMLVAKAFDQAYRDLFHENIASISVYDAPAAESWVVIVNGECWVASGSEDDGFFFWGPLGKKCVRFQIPEGWPT